MPPQPRPVGAQRKRNMTTSVKVTAHCSNDKQVRISKSYPDGVSPDIVIQNGESNEQVVYDDWVISVKEELKPS